MTEQINKYIEKQKSPQKEICQQMRCIILRAFPGIEEEMKWGVPTYAKGKFYLVALRDHVNLGFSIEGISKEQLKRFEGSGKTMKTIAVSSIQEIDENEIVQLMRLVWETQKSKNK